MNNLYTMTNVYALPNDMCYENKAMGAMIGDEPRHGCRLNVPPPPEPEKNAGATLSRMIARRLHFTFVVNSLLTVVLMAFLVSIEMGWMPSLQRRLGFRCNDPSISFPFRGDSVSATALLGGTFVGGLALIAAAEAARERSARRVSGRVVWLVYKELLLGVWFVMIVTEAVKIAFGEHRPHFLDTCRPDATSTCRDGDYVEEYECTNTGAASYRLTDASRSFPSGHSSISMFAVFFLAYIVQTRIPSPSIGRVAKVSLMGALITVGATCSVSRVADRRHHWWDVVTGAALGVLAAAFFAAAFHRKHAARLTRDPTVSAAMLLDVKNKDAASARV